jgi:hypothetical protein
MAQRDMLIITEVAPYVDGPAGVHGVLGQAATALGELAHLHDLHPRVVTTVRELAAADIVNSGVVALFTIGETPFDGEQKAALAENWRMGRVKLLGIHSATDACYGWDEYGALIGARFDGHPWTQDFEIDVVDAGHPATRHLGSTWSWFDEVYRFRSLLPDARILLQVADGQLSLDGVPQGTSLNPLPLAWCRSVGPAKTFYSALGHFPQAWETPTYLRHLEGALEWLVDASGT